MKARGSRLQRAGLLSLGKLSLREPSQFAYDTAFIANMLTDKI